MKAHRKPQAARYDTTTPEAIEAALVSLLASIEAQPEGAPAALAFRSAIRRKGQDLAVIGGREAMAAALARIRAASPERAAAREAVITAAWAGVPGWQA